MAGKIPICPLMTAGNDIQQVCVQEQCAWYMDNLKKCSIYVMGHSSMLEVKEKMDKMREGRNRG